MNPRINQLVKSLLQKESLEQCSLHELQQFAERHPYFGAAQLLLTKKLQTEQSEKFNDQLQKTYLFFHNPLWVEHLLNDTGSANIKQAEKKEQPIQQVEEIKMEPAAIIAQPLVDIPTEQTLIKEEATEILVENIEPAASITQPLIETPVEQTLIKEEATQITEENIELVTEGEESPLQIPGLKIEPFDPNKAELTFEPFHTVDYFASQGIKFKEEEKPKDKFGIQLKSFTDWLKTMKRLPVSDIAKQVESGGEQKVEQLAEHSLQEREVITESMAEVWEKQGNHAKAIAIYTKLSLLEPAKSRYFAAKIEDIKKIKLT